MRILFLCRELPLPLTSGEKIRCYHILKKLAEHHEVSLVSLVLNKSELQYLDVLSKFCRCVYPFEFKLSKKGSAAKSLFSPLPWDVVAFYNRQVKYKVNELLHSQKFDVIWVNFLSMSNYVGPDSSTASKLILDQHNVDELVWKNYAQNSKNIAMKAFALLNQQKIKAYQQKIFKYYDTVISVSKADAQFMEDHVNSDVNIRCIPNGVDTEYFVPISSKNKANIIMLCASMDVMMNIDAALNFSRFFPKIKQKITDSEFWIVGRNPPEKIRALSQEGYIRVTGSVTDIRPYYEKAKVVVAPYRFGGGTKLKIMEAMAMNLPIVSTSIGCQGIDTTGITDIAVRDDMQNFTDTVIELLESSSSDYTTYGNYARKIVEERYSWNSILKVLDAGLLEESK